jgi:hypothetical protein
MGFTMKRSLYSSIILLAGFLFAGVSVVYAQEGPYESVGVSHYVQPVDASYRLLFGEGGNMGLGKQSPQTLIGLLSAQRGVNVLSVGFISSNPVAGGFPRRTYDEFDLMYGLALDQIIQSYGRPSNQFHASISTGISVNDYSMRWHRYGRFSPLDSLNYLEPPNTTELSLGVPVQLQAVYEPFRVIGIGVILFSDFSKLQPSYGGAVALELRY